MTGSLSKEALDALTSDLCETVTEQDTEGEKYEVPRYPMGHKAAAAITALRAENEKMYRQVSFWGEGWAHLESRATAAEAALAAAGAVRVRPLEWEKRDVWFAECPVTSTEYTIWREEGKWWSSVISLDPFESLDAAKEAVEAFRSAPILAALEPNPAVQDREALVAEQVEVVARAMCERDGADWFASDCNHTANGEEPEEQRDYWRDKADAAIRALPTQPQTDALAAVRREARAEGMRMAAAICDVPAAELSLGMWRMKTREECRDAILAAAEQEAGHD